ncbi:17105_t:CDS:10 [Dentiscutata erythropus]|uniref:17105_t:CDS:1 n=1 Tax=Dentiscutata erythropus TaxID=1348616 RepID=A0A9N9F0Z6_9GLOM|nr:17105_t:CDS:10 [Dentiscutata erythropus]
MNLKKAFILDHGAHGAPGRDAGFFLPATNGERGGDGGNAGAGTSGANGGKGGTITLHMNDTDSGLLMLFVTAWTPNISYSLDVNGGMGGRGGTGGRGGKSYSDTQTFRASNGARAVRINYKPGGSPGRNGSNGLRPTSALHSGTPGTNGVFRFLIKNSITNDVTEYNEIYDIRLQDVIIHSVTGAYEPGAKIIIDSINVYNKSNTPTPRRDIRVNINDAKWIHNQKLKEHILLPQRIEKPTLKEINCNQPFSFLIGEHIVDKPGPPLRASDKLHLMATMTGVERVFPTFDINGHTINIQFPIELTRVSHMNSMVVGHVAKVIWKVKNTSNVDFGVQAKNKRLICVRLCKVGGEVSPSALKFGLKPDQKGVSTVPPVQNMENEYGFEIPLLKAGETLKLEAALTLTEAEAFECADFWLYLELGKIEVPSTPKIVHILSFDIRVSTIYRGFPQGFYPDVLLVTNHKTTRDEYLAWVKLFKETLGLRFFTWDISQMGHFSLMSNITTLYSNEPTTLMKDFSGKTMIVLGNDFEYGEYGQKVTARNLILKNEWIEAIHKNDSNAGKDECVNVLDELLTNAFEEFRENKSEFENVRGFTQFMIGKDDVILEEIPPENAEENNLEKNIPEENNLEKNIPKENDLEENDSEEDILEEKFDIKQLTSDPAKLIEEITEVHIRPKLFFNMEKRMRKKATKIDKNLRKLRPHFQHHVIYQWNNVKLSLFQSKKNREKKGGSVIVTPSMTTTKRRVDVKLFKIDRLPAFNFLLRMKKFYHYINLKFIDSISAFLTASWHKSTLEFISTPINLRGIIAGLGIDNHFCILEMIFITGPLHEGEETYDIDLFLKGSHRTLNDKDKYVAELLKQQIIYDIAVELSAICDGVGGNSSLKDEEILGMMENLRRLVWKVESLSGKNCLPPETTKESLLPAISDYNDDVERTVVGDAGVEDEIIFFMFPVKQDTPLGEWMMDQEYPNQFYLIGELQKCNTMDLLHRIGDATIIDFADPRSSEKLDQLNVKIDNSILEENDIENEELIDPPTSTLKEKKSLDSINDVALSLKVKAPLISINDVELSLSKKESLSSINGVADSQDIIPDNPNFLSIQYDNSTEISSPKSIFSGLSFASSMTRASKRSSSSFSSSGLSASRSRITYKNLDPKRQQTINSFEKGAKLQLCTKIQKHYKQWKRASGIFDLSRKDLRRKAMETIFEPFELLVDNTLYGRNIRKKGNGQVGGVKNIIISYPKYNQQKEVEKQRINNIKDMIEKFQIFHNQMILDTVIE